MQDDWGFQAYGPVKGWTGRTLFRVYGMFDVDYQIESTEIREAVTDWDYVGDVRRVFHCLDPSVLEECLSKTISRP